MMIYPLKELSLKDKFGIFIIRHVITPNIIGRSKKIVSSDFVKKLLTGVTF